MLSLSLLRSLVRAGLGRRPAQRDLDRIVERLRRRLVRGGPRPAFAPPRLPPALALRLLRGMQLRKLRRTVAYAARHVPHYRRVLAEAGVGARELRTLADVRRLPLTRRADIEARRDDFLSRAPGLSAAVLLKTSGTSGRPLELFYAPEELDYYVAVQALSGMALGFLGPEHVLQVHLSLDTSISARIFTAAAERSGALVLPLGVMTPLDRALEELSRARTLPGKLPHVSGLFAAPGQLWALAARAEALGLAGRFPGLRRVFTCGAAVSPALRERVERVFGQPVREAYSLSETPSTGAFECERGRLHFLDLSGLLEVLDPATEQPVAPGAPGVAVITAFHPERELMPVLRYWSGDLVVASAETACACGLVSTVIERILGRTDQMLIVGARNVFPQVLGDALVAFPELVQPPRYRVGVEERADAQHVVLDVELATPSDAADGDGLAERIRDSLPIAKDPYVVSGTVGCEVRLVPPGSLREPFRYKLQGAVRHG